MWVRQRAIRSVPSYARIETTTLEKIEAGFDDSDGGQAKLERAFERFERTQPTLADHFAQLFQRPLEETSLALGYFLSLSIWLAFEESFGPRLNLVGDADLQAAAQSLQLDEQLRRDDPHESVDTDDVIAMEQPAIVEFIREHVDVALENSSETVKVEEIDVIYHSILIEVLALSQAVKPPERYNAGNEWTS